MHQLSGDLVALAWVWRNDRHLMSEPDERIGHLAHVNRSALETTHGDPKVGAEIEDSHVRIRSGFSTVSTACVSSTGCSEGDASARTNRSSRRSALCARSNRSMMVWCAWALKCSRSSASLTTTASAA